jgi:hypothetical protein
MFDARNAILRLWAGRCAQDPRLSLESARCRGPLRSELGRAAANALARVVRADDWSSTVGPDAVAACELAEEVP